MYGKEFIILTNIWLFAFCFVHGNLHYSKRKLWTLDRHKRTINQKCSGNIIVKKKDWKVVSNSIVQKCFPWYGNILEILWKHSGNKTSILWKRSSFFL